MTPVGSLDPSATLLEFAAAARSAAFQIESFGTIAGFPLLALTRAAAIPGPRIYLSAGIHGDEPAPPLALLELLKAGYFDQRVHWCLCPLLNPTGFLRRTRENADGLDLNRDYRDAQAGESRAHIRWLEKQPRFDVTLCLHEDWEATGAYLYEQNPQNRPSLAEPITTAMGKVIAVDSAPSIDGHPAAGGIIRPNFDPQTRPRWAESSYLRVHHTSLAYTIETPSGLPLKQRIEAQQAAVKTAVAGVLLNSAV